MGLNTHLNRRPECPLSLNKFQLNPLGATAEALNLAIDHPNFDGGEGTLGPNEPPHVVRLVNDGETGFEQSYRSFPNTTKLGEIDRRGNFTLTVTVRDGGDVSETLTATAFGCNYSTTTLDLSGPDPTARTVSTEMACGTSTEHVCCSARWRFIHMPRSHAVGGDSL
jgi:hypothetical protein